MEKSKKLNKKIPLTDKKIFLTICIVLFRLIIDYVYENIVSPSYSYMGLTINISIERYLVSWIMMIIFIILFLLIVNKKTCGSIIIGGLILCSAIPTTSVVYFFDVDFLYILCNILYWICMVFFFKIIKGIKLPIYHSDSLLYMIFGIFGLAILFICIYYTGFHINFNLYDVYETRAAFEQYDIPTILTYIFSASIIIFPIIFVYAVKRKRMGIAILAVIFQVLAFSADGRKSTLFVLLATIIICFLFKDFKVTVFPITFVGIGIVGILESLITNSINIIDLIFRRLFIIPSYLSVGYYNFFSNHEKDFFRQSILGRLGFESPYVISIPELIGNEAYLGSYANNGLFADAYANLGFFGMFLMPLLIVIVLKFLDECSKNLQPKMCVGIILVSMYTFLSSSFFVVLLTHGFLLGCILISLFPRGTKNVKG